MRMPDVATVDDTVTLLRWLVEVGQPIRRGEPLLESSDKAILVVESSVSGTLHAIAVDAGTEVATGQVIATFEVAHGAAAGSPSAPPARSVPPSDDAVGPAAGVAGVASVPPMGGRERSTETATAVAGRSSPATAGAGRLTPTREVNRAPRLRVSPGPLRADGADPRIRGRGQVPVPRRGDARHDPPVPGAGGDGRRASARPSRRTTSSPRPSAATAMPWPRG